MWFIVKTYRMSTRIIPILGIYMLWRLLWCFFFIHHLFQVFLGFLFTLVFLIGSVCCIETTWNDGYCSVVGVDCNESARDLYSDVAWYNHNGTHDLKIKCVKGKCQKVIVSEQNIMKPWEAILVKETTSDHAWIGIFHLWSYYSARGNKSPSGSFHPIMTPDNDITNHFDDWSDKKLRHTMYTIQACIHWWEDVSTHHYLCRKQ